MTPDHSRDSLHTTKRYTTPRHTVTITLITPEWFQRICTLFSCSYGLAEFYLPQQGTLREQITLFCIYFVEKIYVRFSACDTTSQIFQKAQK